MAGVRSQQSKFTHYPVEDDNVSWIIQTLALCTANWID